MSGPPHIENKESDNTAMFGIFIVALIALLAIGLAIWQPWNPQVPVVQPTAEDQAKTKKMQDEP